MEVQLVFLEDVNKLVEEVILTGETVKQFESYFRAIAGKRLSQCKDINGVLSNCGIVVNGDNEELTREIYLNSIILLSVDELLLYVTSFTTLPFLS